MSDSIFQFSKRDLMAGKTYDPAWYRVRVETYNGAEPSKNLEKPSTNWSYNCTILFDADTGDRKYEDHPLVIRFNSRAMGFLKGFLIALGVPEESIDENTRYDFKNAEGKELDVYIENGLFEGRATNQVNKYRLPRVA